MNKFKEYYSFTGAEIYLVATIFNPHLRLHWYRDNRWEYHWINDGHVSFECVFAPYHVLSEAHVQESLFVHPFSSSDVMDHVYKCPRLEHHDELKTWLNQRLQVRPECCTDCVCMVVNIFG
jgi:hypothetical protein